MAQTITLALITLIFLVLGFNERNFLTNAQKHSASIIYLFTSVSTGDDVPIGERSKEIAKRAKIKLNPKTANEREAKVTLPLSVWQNLEPGDVIQVWAYPDHPKWVFWSPMIRYEHVAIFVKVNFALTAIFFLLTMISLNGMRI
ncbi:hypothetical protein N9M10_02665 [Hellea sp.]|nr:hypothetical protein [Hellea sp.]